MQRFLARMRAALDEIEQDAPADLALFEYVDLLTAQVAELAAPRDLHSAAAAGDIHTTRALLRKPGVDANAPNEEGARPMYIAAARGHTAIVEMLADEGHVGVSKSTPADAKLLLVESWRSNPPPEYFLEAVHGCIPPLYIAARNGRVDTVRALLQRGADVGQPTTLLETALHGASRDGRTAVITVLLDHGAEVNTVDSSDQSPLWVASKGGHIDAIKICLDHGADLNKVNGFGETPMYVAAERGHVEALKVFIDRGGDVNTANRIGETPMWTASVYGHAEAIRILLAAGAAIPGYDSEGRSPFLAAAQGGHCEALTLLLDHGGVDINQRTRMDGGYDENDPGATAVYLASEGGHVEAVKLLLAAGAATGVCDEDRHARGHAPLHIAAEKGHCEVIAVLLDHGGVDINQVVGEYHECPGETAFLIASRNGRVGVIKLLLKRGVDVNQVDEGGWTPVSSASVEGHADAVHVLLKAGADASVATNDGDAPLHLAARSPRRLDVIRVLAEIWPTNPLAWRMFLMGGGAASELQDYLAPPANRTTRNHLPRLYSKPDMVKEIYKYLHKPRYVDLDQLDTTVTQNTVLGLDGNGRTALQIAEAGGNPLAEVATLLRELSLG